MRQWVKRLLRDNTFPQRLVNYNTGYASGLKDRGLLAAQVITQLGAEFEDADSQDGYLDAIEERFLPPAI